MKAIILRFFPLLFLVAGFPALAQREGLSPTESQDPNHVEYTPSDDKAIMSDHDAKARLNARDSIAALNRSTLTPKSKSSEAPKGLNGDDEDALSFNFLYYIIQKFKISDLVDE